MKRNFQQDLVTLDLSESLVDGILRSDMSFEVKTNTFHDAVKNARKSKLKKYHPDVCKDTNATSKAAEINAAADGLLTVQFRPSPQLTARSQPVIVIFQTWSTCNSCSSTSDTTTNTGTFWW